MSMYGTPLTGRATGIGDRAASPCEDPAGPSLELRSTFYACGYAVGPSMAAVFSPPLVKEVTFAPRPRGIRVPGALVPPAVPNLTSVPPTCRWQTVWRQTGQAGWCAARERT